jgi:hypothetical protein
VGKWTDRLHAKSAVPPLTPTAKTVKRGSEGASGSFDSAPIGGCADFRAPAGLDPDDAREVFEERAAILEFAAGLPRAEAESQARAMLSRADLPAKTPRRAYALSRAERDAAHAVPWDEAAIARFLARVAAIRRRGFNADDGEDLAEQLHLLDVQAEGRSLCLNCSHLAGTTATGWRCRNHQRAEMPRELAADFVARVPQRCPGYRAADRATDNPKESTT